MPAQNKKPVTHKKKTKKVVTPAPRSQIARRCESVLFHWDDEFCPESDVALTTLVQIHYDRRNFNELPAGQEGEPRTGKYFFWRQTTNYMSKMASMELRYFHVTPATATTQKIGTWVEVSRIIGIAPPPTHVVIPLLEDVGYVQIELVSPLNGLHKRRAVTVDSRLLLWESKIVT